MPETKAPITNCKYNKKRKNLIEFNLKVISFIFKFVNLRNFQKTIDNIINAVTQCNESL